MSELSWPTSTATCPGCGTTIETGDLVAFFDWSDFEYRGPYCRACFVDMFDEVQDEDGYVVCLKRVESWLGN